jgi:outer membrane protein assembly factor BamB
MSRSTSMFAALLAVLVMTPAPSIGQESQVPPAPTHLTAVALSTSSIQLSWSGTLTNGTYRIERSLDGVAFTEVASTKESVLTYTDGGLLDDYPYAYRVRARQGSIDSEYSGVAVATTRTANAWRTEGGNAAHSGKNGQESGVAPLTLAWSQDLNPPGAFTLFSVTPLVVEKDRVYTTMSPNSSPDYPSMLWSLDLSSGQIRWAKDFGLGNVREATVRHGRVFVTRDQGSGTPGQVDAYHATSGLPLWSTPLGTIYNSVVPAANNGLFMLRGTSALGGGLGGIGGIGGIGIGSGSLLRFNAANGQQVYANTSLEGPGPLAAVANGSVFTFAAGKVRGHDAATGATQWTVPIGPQPSSANGIPVAGGGLVYVIFQRSVFAVNPATQSIVWMQSGYGVQNITPAYADGVLYVNNAGTILALDGATGAPLWSFTDSLHIEYPPVVANNHLFLATRNDLFAVNLATRRTTYSERNIWAGPLAVAQGKLLVAGIDGVVKAYTLSPGSLPDQAAPPAAPQALTATGKGTGAVLLNWTDASTNETGFRVERSTNGGATYSLLTTMGAGAVELLDSGLVNPQSYQYRVAAFNDAGLSAASNTVTFVPPAPGNSWNMLGQNAQHTGVNAKEAPRTMSALAWSWSAGSLLTPAVVEDGRVFTASRPDRSPVLTSLDAATGAVLWSQSVEAWDTSYGHPSVINGRVYVTFVNQPDSKLMCAEASTGRILWAVSYMDGGFTGGSPTIANGAAYIPGGISGLNFLYSFNAIDGRQKWARPDAFAASVQGTTIYSHWKDQFQAVNSATGNAVWTTPMAVGSIPTMTATRAYGVTNRDLFAINLSTHAVVGTVASGNLNNFYTEPSVQGGNLYWVTDGVLQVRRETDLALLWSFTGDGQLRTRPVIAGGHVYVSSLDNTYILRISTRSRVATLPGGGAVTVAAGKLFVAGLDGELRAYRLQ